MFIKRHVIIIGGKIAPYCEYCKHESGFAGCEKYPEATSYRRFPTFPACLNYPPSGDVHFEIDPEKCRPGGWEGLEVQYPDWNTPDDDEQKGA